MKTKTVILGAGIFLALSILQALAQSKLASNGRHAEGELLVKWKDGPESYAAAIGNSSIGAEVKRNFNEIGWQHVKLPTGLSLREGMAQYQALGTVLVVEPNYAMPVEPPTIPPVAAFRESAVGLSLEDSFQSSSLGLASPPGRATSGLTSAASSAGVIPNDPKFNSQWNLKIIGMTNAWAITTGSSNVVVALLDTGVDYNHEDLKANMWRNPGETGLDANGNDKATNGIDDDGDGYVDDVYGVDVVNGTGDPMDTGVTSPPDTSLFNHGTVCAGLIGAVGNNGKGMAGINWSVQIMAIRRLAGNLEDPSVFTVPIFINHLLASWDYVLKMKRRGVNIRITNNSYGTLAYSLALRDAVATAGDEGILSVFSAGNEAYNSDVFSELQASFNLPSVINVAASTRSDSLADFSNYGRSTVQLAAPGDDLISTLGGSNQYDSGDSGTSFACPHVVGAAALLLSVNPNLTVDQLKAAILGSVDQPPSLKGKLVTNGRLNVARALEYLTNSNPSAIVITALPAGQRTPTNFPIQVTFNRPMNRASVESALAINPPVNGTFEWADDSRSFSFRHDAPFDSATNYTVRILGTAQDDTGGTLDGNFNRSREGSPADDFVWTFTFPVANDDFANAQQLTNASGVVTGSNRYTTPELDEPDQVGDRTSSSSVWYRWTPGTSGWVTFDLTSGTVFDSLLAVYTGDRLDHLAAVAGNDNYGGNTRSRVSFMAAAGTNYSVAIAGKSLEVRKRSIDPTQSGNFKLTWYPTPPPGFTGAAFSPAQGVAGSKVILTGTNFTAATRVQFNGISASFSNVLTNNADLKITAIVPPGAGTGPITVQTPQGDATTSSSFMISSPSLAIESLDANRAIIIRWQPTGAVLEVADSLGAGANWTRANVDVSLGPCCSVFLTTTNGPRFYRLRKP